RRSAGGRTRGSATRRRGCRCRRSCTASSQCAPRTKGRKIDPARRSRDGGGRDVGAISACTTVAPEVARSLIAQRRTPFDGGRSLLRIVTGTSAVEYPDALGARWAASAMAFQPNRDPAARPAKDRRTMRRNGCVYLLLTALLVACDRGEQAPPRPLDDASVRLLGSSPPLPVSADNDLAAVTGDYAC